MGVNDVERLPAQEPEQTQGGGNRPECESPMRVGFGDSESGIAIIEGRFPSLSEPSIHPHDMRERRAVSGRLQAPEDG